MNTVTDVIEKPVARNMHVTRFYATVVGTEKMCPPGLPPRRELTPPACPGCRPECAAGAARPSRLVPELMRDGKLRMSEKPRRNERTPHETTVASTVVTSMCLF